MTIGSRANAILLVDDDPTVRKVGSQALAAAGFRVVCAADGAAAGGRLPRVLVAKEAEFVCIVSGVFRLAQGPPAL